MFIRRAKSEEIQEVADTLEDYDLIGDLQAEGRLFSIVHKKKLAGILQITPQDGFNTIDVALLKKHRGKWLSRHLLKQVYKQAFKNTDVVVGKAVNPKAGNIMVKLGFQQYAIQDGFKVYVLYKTKLKKEYKIDG